ncbi:RICIN domain-containing protein [Actinophytocola sp.]|uniref:RICIN domain-containing protein n=1 Tax=Actinophytocola sp. TaxID=1872138 RepID=UPI002ED237E7
MRSLLLSAILLLGGAGAVTASADAAPESPVTALAGVHLHKEASNQCLVARVGPGERPVEQTPCAGFSDQDWDFFQVTHNGEVVNQIHNIDRNLCLVTRGTGETPAVVTTCNGGFADQLWRAFLFSDGTWRFQNVNSGLCLVARGTSQATQTTCAGFTDQFWFLD